MRSCIIFRALHSDRFVGGEDVYFPYLTDVLKLSHYHGIDRRFIVGTNQGD